MTIRLQVALWCALVFAACGSATARIGGNALAGATGMPLHIFERDAADAGKPVCHGPCTAGSPPLTASGTAKPSDGYTPVVRDDDRTQWAFKGKPLHFREKDQKPGDKTGDGFDNVWHVAKE
jgi:predicted lipoprotein with Yx(FWY)xxD motif